MSDVTIDVTLDTAAETITVALSQDDLSNNSITDLSDVAGTPSNNEVLKYSTATSKWGPAADSGAVDSVNGATGTVVLDTDDISEGSSNLYYTNTRADARAQLKIDALVDSAPGALDTLNELAAALGDDASFSSTMTTSLAGKEPTITAGTSSQYYRGDKTFQTLDTTAVAEGTNLYYTNTRADARITNAGSANWNTAYGWGNHASGGYLTSETSHTDVVVDGDFSSQGIMLRGASGGTYSILADASANWNTAYGWGNHASAGYITATLTDEQVQDKIGAMLTGNTETLITVAYEDGDGTIDFTVDNDLSNYDNSTSAFLTSETSHADVVQDGDFSSQGIMLRGAGAGTYSILTDASANWNTAYTHSQAAHAPSGAEANQNAFQTIAVSGQSNVVADTATDTLTFAEGSNITITTAAGTDTITIASAGGGLDNVVEDTTPQLGGGLDTVGNAISTSSGTHVAITNPIQVSNLTNSNNALFQSDSASGQVRIKGIDSASNLTQTRLMGSEVRLQSTDSLLKVKNSEMSHYAFNNSDEIYLRLSRDAGWHVQADTYDAEYRLSLGYESQIFQLQHKDPANSYASTTIFTVSDATESATTTPDGMNMKVPLRFSNGTYISDQDNDTKIALNNSDDDIITFTSGGSDVVKIDKSGTGTLEIKQDHDAGNKGIYFNDRTNDATAKIYVRDNSATHKRLYIINDADNDIGRNSSQYISAATVNAGGSGYAVDDKLTIAGGSNAGDADAAVLNVDSVDGSGAVTDVSLDLDAGWRTGGAYSSLPSTPNSVTTDGSGTSCTLNLTFTSDSEAYYMIHRTEGSKDRTDYYTGSTTAGEGYYEIRYNGSRDWSWNGAPVKIYAGNDNGTQSSSFKYYSNWSNVFNIHDDGPVIPSGKKLTTEEVQSTGNMTIQGDSEYDELDLKFSKMKFSDYDTGKLKFEFNNDLGFQVRDNSALGQDKASIAIWRENGSNTENTGYIWRLHEGSGSDTARGLNMQWQNYTGSTLNDPIQIMSYDEDKRVQFDIPIRLKSFTVAEANALSSKNTGDMIWVSDGDTGDACVSVYDGSNWKVIALGATISAS